MKQLLLILSVFIIQTCYAQDEITMETGKVYNVEIQRITTDSVYFYYQGDNRREAINMIKGFKSDDDFKTFMLSKEENPKHITDYTNYCLLKYGVHANAGKFITLIGAGTSIYSLVKLRNYNVEDSEATPDDYRKAQIIGIIGGGITCLGILIDMSANSWLKNLSVAPNYVAGIGYKFEF